MIRAENDITLVRVDDGLEGPQGPQGERGPQGEQGPQGEKGEQGIPGIGQDGRTSYLHIAYATSADGSEGFSISESANKTYIGQYTDFISTDSTDPTKYAWAKIKGETGADGKTYYTWIKYADSPTSGMSDNPSGKAYIGIAHNKTSATESTTYSDYTWSLIKGETGADGYSPTVTTGTSEDGSTTVTVTNKDGSTTTTLVDGTARADVNSLNNAVFGVQTFEYILDGVTIPVHKRGDGTYYYILNDEEVTVAEADLVHDADGDLVSYQEGGIDESLNDITNNIDAINIEVDGFNAREDALYKSIQDNSLIARKNARVTENSIIITNDTTTDDIKSLLNYLQLNADSIMIYGDGDSIVTIAKDESNAGYMEMAGTSLLIAQESRLSTIRLRSADRIGSLAFVAGSDGHVSLREVLD